MGAIQCCGGLLKQNLSELLIVNVLQTLKLNQLNFNCLYQRLADKEFPKDCDKIEQEVSILKVKKVLEEEFSSDDIEHLDIQKELGEKLFKKFKKIGKDKVPLHKVMLRLIPFLSDSINEKVFYFFAVTSNSFIADETNNELFLIEPVKSLIHKYLKYNLLQITNFIQEIASEKTKHSSLKDEIKQNQLIYSDENLREYFEAKFNFSKRSEELETFVRTIKANCKIFDYSDIRSTFQFFLIKKEKDNILSQVK